MLISGLKYGTRIQNNTCLCSSSLLSGCRSLIEYHSSFNYLLLSAEHGAASGVWSPGHCHWCGPGAAAVAATLTANTGLDPAPGIVCKHCTLAAPGPGPGVCDVTRPDILIAHLSPGPDAARPRYRTPESWFASRPIITTWHVAAFSQHCDKTRQG